MLRLSCLVLVVAAVSSAEVKGLAKSLPKCLEDCVCGADLTSTTHDKYDPSNPVGSCRIQKAFAQSALRPDPSINNQACSSDCKGTSDEFWIGYLSTLASLPCEEPHDGVWAKNEGDFDWPTRALTSWRYDSLDPWPTAERDTRRLIEARRDFHRALQAVQRHCTIAPTAAPTTTPSPAPTWQPTNTGDFIHSCLGSCPCKHQGYSSASCSQAKAFAIAALRQPRPGCTATCGQDVLEQLRAAARRDCENGGVFDEGSEEARGRDSGWPPGRNLRAPRSDARRDPRRRLASGWSVAVVDEASDTCTLAPTAAPTAAPTKAPTESPTQAPTAETGCRTAASGGGVNGNGKKCVFPFTYKGVTHSTCTDVDSSTGLWCSTKVDWWGNHVGGDGNYGRCVETRACPLECRTNADATAPKPKRRCAFPFVYQNKVYNESTGCAFDAAHPGGWCSTMTDFFGQHIQGHWGYCNTEGCPQRNPTVALRTPADTGLCDPASADCFESATYTDPGCTAAGRVRPYPPLSANGSCISWTYTPESEGKLDGHVGTGVHRSRSVCDAATDTLKIEAGCDSCAAGTGECLTPAERTFTIDLPLGQCVALRNPDGTPVTAPDGQQLYSKATGRCKGSANSFPAAAPSAAPALVVPALVAPAPTPWSVRLEARWANCNSGAIGAAGTGCTLTAPLPAGIAGIRVDVGGSKYAYTVNFVDVSVDGGATWERVAQGQNTRDFSAEYPLSVTLQVAAGAAELLVRANIGHGGNYYIIDVAQAPASASTPQPTPAPTTAASFTAAPTPPAPAPPAPAPTVADVSMQIVATGSWCGTGQYVGGSKHGPGSINGVYGSLSECEAACLTDDRCKYMGHRNDNWCEFWVADKRVFGDARDTNTVEPKTKTCSETASSCCDGLGGHYPAGGHNLYVKGGFRERR